MLPYTHVGERRIPDLVPPIDVDRRGGGLVGQSLAHAKAPGVLLIKVDGVINGVKERFISRAIDRGVEEEAVLLVIELDTPGGLLDSTRNIVEELLEAPLPVAVYVSPRGARAGSAGTFITAAGHFAVMAPGTNIGAATPISGTGEDLEDTLATKAENDAAALIRSIAQVRGRNEEKLEETVRKASSFSALEAGETKHGGLYCLRFGRSPGPIERTDCGDGCGDPDPGHRGSGPAPDK